MTSGNGHKDPSEKKVRPTPGKRNFELEAHDHEDHTVTLLLRLEVTPLSAASGVCESPRCQQTGTFNFTTFYIHPFESNKRQEEETRRFCAECLDKKITRWLSDYRPGFSSFSLEVGRPISTEQGYDMEAWPKKIIKRFGLWSITSFGIEHLNGIYLIPREKIFEESLDYNWAKHMELKGWVNMDDFNAALHFAQTLWGAEKRRKS